MNGLLKPILDALVKQVADPSNPVVGFIAKWLLHALGDKTTTIIGGVVAYLFTFANDHQDITNAIASLLPANIAHVVAIAIPYILVIFGGYLTTPKKGAAIVGAVSTAIAGLLIFFCLNNIALAQSKTLTWQSQINGDLTAQAVTLTLYADTGADSVLWQEIQVLSTTDKRLDVELGLNPRNPLPTLPDEAWLGVKIAADTEMRPLAHIASGPFARVAHVNINGHPYTGEINLISDSTGYLKFAH